MKKFWWGIAGLGVIVFIAGLILTIVLVNETGEVRPDSECSSSMRASVLASCVVSDDPKVLLGVAPLLLGVAMVGVGIWRGIVTPSSGGSGGGSGGDSGGDSGGGFFGSLQALQDKAMQIQESAMGSVTTAGDGTPALPPAPPPESSGSPPNTGA